MKRSDISDLEVCKAVAEYQEKRGEGEFPYEALAKKFGCSEKLAYRACERADDNGLIECGVSLRTGWLSEKGLELIKQNS